MAQRRQRPLRGYEAEAILAFLMLLLGLALLGPAVHSSGGARARLLTRAIHPRSATSFVLRMLAEM